MSKPASVNLAQERRALLRMAPWAIGVCIAVLVGGYYALPSVIDFPHRLDDRWVFWARLQVVPWLWVAYGVGAVSRARRTSAQDIWGSAYGPPSENVAVRVAFLQNTLEQAALATGAYLVLVTLISGPALSLLSTAVVLFCIGRLTFLWGYRKGAAARGFGFVLTILPTLGAYALAVALLLRQAFQSI